MSSTTISTLVTRARKLVQVHLLALKAKRNGENDGFQLAKFELETNTGIVETANNPRNRVRNLHNIAVSIRNDEMFATLPEEIKDLLACISMEAGIVQAEQGVRKSESLEKTDAEYMSIDPEQYIVVK